MKTVREDVEVTCKVRLFQRYSAAAHLLQQDLDTEERNILREEQDRQREHDKVQQDKYDMFRLAQMEREKEKEQREREE